MTGTKAFSYADRLSVIADAIKDRFREDAETELMLALLEVEDGQTVVIDGEKYTLQEKKLWDYPEDTYITKLSTELNQLSEKVTNIKQSINVRQEAIRLMGDATLVDTTHIIKIAKK
jgi:hypothetical protein